VKRYSSGMYVRLAFAVAAHLDPEILVVDEVLAVGDAAFQKKCLGKMGDIAGHGRTVLFVSHNMQAVQSLCSAAILIDKGRVVLEETPGRVVARYLGDSLESSALSWESPAGIGDSSLRLTKVEVLTGAGIPAKGTLQSRDDITIRLVVDLARPIPGLCVGFDLLGRDNATLLRTYDTDTAPESFRPLTEGTNILRCTLRGGLLNGGRYRVAPRIGIHNQKWIVTSDPLIEFDVVLDHGMSPYWNVLDGSNRPGMIAPLLTWSRPDA
jgi:lipopolysaccharide transport system ATP-binding protein